MKAAWTIPVFTPAKFALLALTVIAVTLGADGIAAPRERAPISRPIDSVARDFGTFTNTEFLIPAPPKH